MIANYDKENGFSSIFSNLGSQVANVSSDDEKILNDIQKRISLESQLANEVDWDNYIKSHNNASESLKSFLKDTNYAEKSLANYQVYLENIGNTTSKFSSFTSKAGSAIKSFGKSLGANLLNMGAGMLAGVAINGIISGVDYLIHYQDRLIEKGEEAKNSISETFSEFTTVKSSLDSLGTSFADNADDITSTSGAIDVIAQKYSELSQGVNTLNNANKSLSSTIFIMIGINVFSFCYAWLISAIVYATLPLCRIFHGIDDYHILYKPGCRNKLQEAKQLMLTYIHPLFIFLSNIYLTNANNFTIYICIFYIQIVYQFFRLQHLQRLRMPFYLQS